MKYSQSVSDPEKFVGVLTVAPSACETSGYAGIQDQMYFFLPVSPTA